MPHGAPNSLRRHTGQAHLLSYTPGNIAIAHRTAIRYGKQILPHPAAELSALKTERWHKQRDSAREIYVKPTSCLYQNRQRGAILILSPQCISKELLPVKPKAYKSLTVASEGNTTKRRIIMGRVFHYSITKKMKSIRYSLQIETDRAETVVTTYHCTHRILHPAIVEITLASCQRLCKRPDAIPCRRAHAFGHPTVDGHPLLTNPNIARVLNGILVFGNQVLILRLP